MKIRNDFVTNSSSSSFIVDKNDVSFGKLIKAILEIANTEYDWYWSDEENDLSKNVKKKKEFKVKDIDFCTEYGEEWLHVASHYYVKCSSQDNPFRINNQWGNFTADKSENSDEYDYTEENKKSINDGVRVYDHHYLVDNLAESRYDWSLVEDVLNKYGIPWEYGYCD